MIYFTSSICTCLFGYLSTIGESTLFLQLHDFTIRTIYKIGFQQGPLQTFFTEKLLFDFNFWIKNLSFHQKNEFHIISNMNILLKMLQTTCMPHHVYYCNTKYIQWKYMEYRWYIDDGISVAIMEYNSKSYLNLINSQCSLHSSMLNVDTSYTNTMHRNYYLCTKNMTFAIPW